MTALPCGEDPEPSEPGPAGPFFVPVRPGPAGCVARLFRTPVGGRTAVAFTTPQRLGAALGDRQAWVRLSEPALRALTEPLGVREVTVDPRLAAHPVGPPERPTPAWREWNPQAVGALRVTGAAALVGALTAWIG
ncbi:MULTISPECIES: SAV_915 family protein [unclassified Streptomyces]|uniref:SAV_915 family protein n=1 Tax=unclassified Streptomyces TaxID=2593676 RepID=UPI0034072E2A